jgi:hypothetical protein
MSDIAPVVQMFQAWIREELPELAPPTGTATPDGFGNFTLLDIPCRWSSSRLGVLYRGDCFEISFSVAEARGPASGALCPRDSLNGFRSVPLCVGDYLA